MFAIVNKSNLVEDFIKAGNSFIIEDNYALAAEAFERAGHLYIIDGHRYIYQQIHMLMQLIIMLKIHNIAINIYLEEGKFPSAAKQLQPLAEIYQIDKQIDLAIESYEKSCKWL